MEKRTKIKLAIFLLALIITGVVVFFMLRSPSTPSYAKYLNSSSDNLLSLKQVSKFNEAARKYKPLFIWSSHLHNQTLFIKRLFTKG